MFVNFFFQNFFNQYQKSPPHVLMFKNSMKNKLLFEIEMEINLKWRQQRRECFEFRNDRRKKQLLPGTMILPTKCGLR